MPRIQKKRKSASRKKRKPTGERRISPGSGVDESARSLASGQEKKKSPVASQKRTMARTAPAPGMQKKGYISTVSQFLREVVVELKKVTWPSRKQTTGSTLVMIILVILVSLFLGMVDIGLSSLVRVVLQ